MSDPSEVDRDAPLPLTESQRAHMQRHVEEVHDGDAICALWHHDLRVATLESALSEAEASLASARERIRELEQAAHWQPIETAPKDGTVAMNANPPDLVRFAERILDAASDSGSLLDVLDVMHIGVECGVLEVIDATEPCGEVSQNG